MPKIKLKHQVANALVIVVLGLFRRLSGKHRTLLSHSIAGLIFTFAHKTRRRALANVKQAMPTKAPSVHDRIALLSYKNIVHGVVECFWLPELEFEYVIDEGTRALLASRDGASIATMHMGCYEAVPFAIQKLTSRSTTISKLPRFVKFAHRVYQDAGIDCIDKNQQGAFISLLKAIAGKRFVSVHSDHFATDTRLHFFGRETGAPTGAAMLSAYGKVPLLLAYAVTSAQNRYTVFIETISAKPIGTSKPELSAAMRTVYTRFEAIILAHPEHWYWSYKRWR